MRAEQATDMNRRGMSPERWRRLKLVLEEVESLSGADRASLLDRLCGGDAELRRAVERYLKDDPGGKLIEEIIGGQAANLRAAAPEPVDAGQKRFGRYQVLRRIGQGGMGAVYEASRVDDFQKKVALKIIHQGLDSDYARMRFLQERQLLATLEHPYIARLLDGGQTEEGSPYLVLEFVDGVPITDYCGRLDREARLRLFLKVCAAVQHAHGNLVVHRDLKPANILVTADGDPKLLDFGIAKLIDSGVSPTLSTFVALTPSYASPEQVRGESIGAASDVYSLGVVLYEMLTGRRPYRVDATSVADIARTVCEVQPERAGVGADLDNILAMALRKDAARRYASVRDFADDLERFLTHMPVRARPDSLGYRASKFLRRNRVALAAAAVLVGALSGALAVTVRAELRERARFNQVRQLATKFLFEFDSDIRRLPGATAAREKLVRTALQQLDSLSADSADDPGLTAELAQAYASVGDVQGMPGMPSLGHTDQAEQSYRKAAALSRGLLDGDASPASPYRLLACNMHTRLGFMLSRIGRAAEGRPLIVQGLGYIQPKLSSGKAAAADYRAAANGHIYLSNMDHLAFRAHSASAEAAQAVALMRKYQELSPGIRARVDLARLLLQAGSAAVTEGNLEQGLAQMKESVETREAIRKEEPRDPENLRGSALADESISGILFDPEGIALGREREALPLMEESIRLFRELMDEDPRNASAREDLALNLPQLAELEPHQAASLLHESLILFESLPPTFAGRDRHIGLILCDLASLQRREKRLAEAGASLAEAERKYARENPADPLARGDFLVLWNQQAEFALRTGDSKAAVAAWMRVWNALSPFPAAAREDMSAAFQMAVCARSLSRAFAQGGDAAEAARWQVKSAEVWQGWKGRYPAADRQLD